MGHVKRVNCPAWFCRLASWSTGESCSSAQLCGPDVLEEVERVPLGVLIEQRMAGESGCTVRLEFKIDDTSLPSIISTGVRGEGTIPDSVLPVQRTFTAAKMWIY
jgi:hypothetical protein